MKSGMLLHGWPIGLVEKSLRTLAAEGALAKKERANNVLLVDDRFNVRALEVMKELIGSDDSLVMIGGRT